MKTKAMKYLVLASALASSSALASATQFEDFSNSINMDKFWGMEETIELDTVTEKLNVSAKGRAYGSNSRSNNLALLDSSSNMLQANVSLSEASLSNPDTQQVLLAVAGTFYNADSANPSTELGEVFARIALGDRGNGLEAWYEVQVSTADDWSDGTNTEASLGSINLNTEYTAMVSYDGDDTFTFQFDNGPIIAVDGPPRMGPPYYSSRAINNRIRFGQDNSTPYLYDGMQDIGEPASIVGTVDEVVTDAGLVDDFSGANLDQDIWAADETSVEIVNNAMEMQVIGQGNQKTERFWIRQKGLDSFGATITLLSSSTINDTTRFRGRLTHYLSNDTYDVANGDALNGEEGFVWTQFIIERSGGNNRVVVSAERVTDAGWTTWDDLFWEEVGNINLDQPYELLIEKIGTQVQYRLDGVLVYSFDLATDYNTILSGNDYEPTGDVPSGLQTRVQDDAGKAHVRFDNIVTDYVPPTVILQAYNVDDAEIDYPTSVNVHEGEEIDLVANINNPGMVSDYIWEQTGGTDVVIVNRSAARGVVGNDPNLSFNVPMGSDNETLSFELTVLDHAGTETIQPFSMRVDNSAPATFAASGGNSTSNPSSNNSSGSSSGGGAFNLWVIFSYAALSGMACLRRRK